MWMKQTSLHRLCDVIQTLSTPHAGSAPLHGQAQHSILTAAEAWFAPLPTALALAAILSGAAEAHHSFANIYDSEQTVTLNATVREFQFIHPHPFLIVEVRNEADERHTWRAEMDNRFELEAIGMTRSTFRPGDRVIVSGSPGRGQAFILYLWRLDRPADKVRYLQVGSTPSFSTLNEE
jgi:hypothetical protein